jgi:RNA polymerase sigma-70 factor (ECF subfamily)
MNSTPASLLERLRQPADQAAWSRFVDLYAPLIFYWSRRAGLQETDAADLVQEVLLTLLIKMPHFIYDPSKSFRSWLRRVTLNKWQERERRAAPVQTANAAELAEVAGPEQLDTFWDAEYFHHLAHRALELMQADFQPTTWKACWELVVNGRPAAEVARELGISVGAAHAAKFRVLARLRQELHGLMD